MPVPVEIHCVSLETPPLSGVASGMSWSRDEGLYNQKDIVCYLVSKTGVSTDTPAIAPHVRSMQVRVRISNDVNCGLIGLGVAERLG